MDSSKHYYFVIAAMLLALLLFTWSQSMLWSWLTNDLRDGFWACSLISHISPSGTASANKIYLQAIEGRLVWAASAFLLLVVILAIISASIFTLLTSIGRWRPGIAVGAILFIIGFVFAHILIIRFFHDNNLQLILTGNNCMYCYTSSQSVNFSHMLLLLLQSVSGIASTKALMDDLVFIEQLLPSIMLLCNIMLISALIAMVVKTIRQEPDTEILRKQFALFRLLLMLGSALFTVINLYHLSQFGWLAQQMQIPDGSGTGQLRELQRGVTIYFGTMNSIGLLLIYLPPGWILWQHALILCQKQTRQHSLRDQSEWLTDNQLTILSGPLMRIAVASAPLLVSGAVMLLEQALMAG